VDDSETFGLYYAVIFAVYSAVWTEFDAPNIISSLCPIELILMRSSEYEPLLAPSLAIAGWRGAIQDRADFTLFIIVVAAAGGGGGGGEEGGRGGRNG